MNIRFTKDPNNNQKRFGLNPFVKNIKFYKKYLNVLRHQRCLNINANGINENEEIQYETTTVNINYEYVIYTLIVLTVIAFIRKLIVSVYHEPGRSERAKHE